MTDFFEGYTIWTDLRFNRIVKEYKEDFFLDKTLLELGCGTGDFGNRFHELGAKVTCVDGRESHIEILRTKYPHLESYVFDLTNNGLGTTVFFDIILHAGLLYHLENPEASIQNSCKQCHHLILETVILNSDDANHCKTRNEPNYEDQSISHVGSLASSAFIERSISNEKFTYKRITDELDIGHRCYTTDCVGGSHTECRGVWICERESLGEI